MSPFQISSRRCTNMRQSRRASGCSDRVRAASTAGVRRWRCSRPSVSWILLEWAVSCFLACAGVNGGVALPGALEQNSGDRPTWHGQDDLQRLSDHFAFMEQLNRYFEQVKVRELLAGAKARCYELERFVRPPPGTSRQEVEKVFGKHARVAEFGMTATACHQYVLLPDNGHGDDGPALYVEYRDGIVASDKIVGLDFIVGRAVYDLKEDMEEFQGSAERLEKVKCRLGKALEEAAWNKGVRKE
jgi:hypothetical protein